MIRFRFPVAFLLALLAGCRAAAPEGPISVSHVGAAADGGGAAGLVRLDADGRVVPALALRWAILGDGRDYLFRIDDAPGRPAAATIARRLRMFLGTRLGTASARREQWPAQLELAQAVTPTVVELRLLAPQPDLLQLLALPGLALAADGAFERTDRGRDTWLLRPTTQAGSAARPVLLRQERAGRAVARFRAGAAALVTGGTFDDLPVAAVAGLDPARLRFDPATGLFGLAPVAGSPYAAPDLVRALGLVLDKTRIVDDIGAPGLVAAPADPGAARDADPALRLATARDLIARAGGPPPSPVRVAMPGGPGGRLLFAHLAHDWAALGLQAVMVAPDAPADLMLVDRVLPAGSVPALACLLGPGCTPPGPGVTGVATFIAITTPVRWSLVDPTLDNFHANPLAAHPLDQLRSRP